MSFGITKSNLNAEILIELNFWNWSDFVFLFLLLVYMRLNKSFIFDLFERRNVESSKLEAVDVRWMQILY